MDSTAIKVHQSSNGYKTYTEKSIGWSVGGLTTKIQINADLNASYQMIKKIHPNIQYNNSLIDTKGSFFSTFNKQHKNKKAIKVEELTQQSKSIGNTKYYLYEGDIAQHKILPSKQQKFRPKYIRTFTLFLQETKPNKVA